MNKKYFQISEVDVEQFATFPIPVTDSKKVKIDVNLDLTINDEKRIINCSFKIVMRLLEEIIITLQVKCAYSVNRETWVQWVDSESRKTDIPIEIVENISETTISTARGILYAKTESTKHSSFILPILDMRAVIAANQ